MDNPKSVGESAAGATVDGSKKRNQDHSEGSKKSEGINEFDRPLKKCKTNKIDEDEKIDQKNEIIELSRSIKELTEAVKSLPETLLTMLKVVTNPEITEEEEEERHPGCHMRIPKNPCIDCQKVGHHKSQTILVSGLEEFTLPRDQVKEMLRHLFGSCGEITRLSVPIDYETGFPFGFAFVDLKNGQGYEKALELDDYELEGVQLDVALAQNRCLSIDFGGCERCMSDAGARRHSKLLLQSKMFEATPRKTFC